MEPFGDTWRQTARLASEVEQTRCVISASHGVAIDSHPEEYFMPIKSKTEIESKSIGEQFDSVAAVFGVPPELMQ